MNGRNSIFVGVLALLAVPAPAQDRDRFDAIHARLTTAADQVLTNTQADADVPDATPAAAPLEQAGASLSTSAGRRVAALRPLIAGVLREERLPDELLGVVLVESGGDPRALSPRGALGMWQLMPETARRFGLIVGPARDDRLDPLLSTRAAARYLRFLFDRYRDWELVFAAYNAGEARVDRAIELSRRPEFAALRLPAETRQYVPAVKRAVSLFRAKSLQAAGLTPVSFTEQGE